MLLFVVLCLLLAGLGLRYRWLIETNHYDRRQMVKNLLCCRLRRDEKQFVPGQIALVQFDGEINRGNPDSNRAELLKLAGKAVEQGANIIVFPEGSTQGYGSKRTGVWCRAGVKEVMIAGSMRACTDVSSVAEIAPGGVTETLWSAFSRQHKVYVVFNLITRRDGDFFNTLVVSGPDGYIGSYDKIYLMPEEKYFASPGNQLFVLKTPYGRFGLMVCNDTWLGRELIKDYKNKDVDAFIVSTFWDSDEAALSTHDNAKYHFSRLAIEAGTDLLVADNAFSDGTGMYRSCALKPRPEPDRNGFDVPAFNQAGISIHSISY